MASKGIRIIPKAKDPISPFVDLGLKYDWHLKAAFARDPDARIAGQVTFSPRTPARPPICVTT